MIGDYERRRTPVPQEVRAIPPGLTHGHVTALTRSDKSVDRLVAHPGGPLVEVIDVPNSPHDRATRPTVPLVVLTPAGRSHLDRHIEEYQHLYPETPLP